MPYGEERVARERIRTQSGEVHDSVLCFGLNNVQQRKISVHKINCLIKAISRCVNNQILTIKSALDRCINEMIIVHSYIK